MMYSNHFSPETLSLCVAMATIKHPDQEFRQDILLNACPTGTKWQEIFNDCRESVLGLTSHPMGWYCLWQITRTAAAFFESGRRVPPFGQSQHVFQEDLHLSGNLPNPTRRYPFGEWWWLLCPKKENLSRSPSNLCGLVEDVISAE